MTNTFLKKADLDYLISFRPYPIPQFKPGRSVIGERLIYYFNSQIKTELPNETKEKISKMDNYRNRSLACQSLNPEAAEVFLNYVSLLRSLTSGVSIQKDGADILFCWENSSFNDIGFDILCLGINLISIGFKTISLNSLTTLPIVASSLKLLSYIKLISNSISSFQNPDFGKLIPQGVIEQIESSLIAFQSYGILSMYLIKENYYEAANASFTLHTELKRSWKEPDSEYVNYWHLFSVALYATASSLDHTLTKTIGYLELADPLYPKFKFKDKPLKPQCEKLVKFVKEKTQEQNSLKTAAFGRPDNVQCTTLKEIPPIKIPEFTPESGSITILGSLKDEILKSIQQSLKNFQDNSKLAQNDQDDAIAKYPSKQMNELNDAYSKFATLRELVSAKITTFENTLNLSRGKLGGRINDISKSFLDYKNKFNAARQSDSIGETHAAQARSYIQTMTDLVDKLAHIRESILSLVNQATKHLADTSNYLENKNLSTDQLLNTKTTSLNFLKRIAQELQALCEQNHNLSGQLRDLASRDMNHFVHTQGLALGCFSQGNQFYSSLNQALETLQTNL